MVPVYIFLIFVLGIDFVYTVVFWLGKERPHPFDRYCYLVGLLGIEAALISVFVTLALGE